MDDEPRFVIAAPIRLLRDRPIFGEAGREELEMLSSHMGEPCWLSRDELEGATGVERRPVTPVEMISVLMVEVRGQDDTGA